MKIIQLGNIAKEKNFSNPQTGRIYSILGLSPCLNTMQGGGREPKVVVQDMKTSELRIRKLTPKECWRLQGFDDADFEKAQSTGLSNSQLYKQAGNSICVPVIQAVFEKLFAEVDMTETVKEENKVKTDELYAELWRRKGMDHQLTICLEELAELQKEVCKKLRSGLHIEEIAEEVADVEICLDQMKFIFGLGDKVSKCKDSKLSRLESRLMHNEDL